MKGRFLHCVLCLSLAAFADTALSRDREAFGPIADPDAFMQAYYSQPQPERIEAFLKSLGDTGFLKGSGAIPPVGGFLSEVFRANPAKLDRWQSIANKRDRETQSAVALAIAITRNKDGALGVQKVSAETNDIYWGAFFASGDLRYIDKLINELILFDLDRYAHKSTTTRFDSTDDFASFTAGATAVWSLAANLPRHNELKLVVQEAELNAAGRVRELLHDVQTKSPTQIQAEIREVLSRPLDVK